MSKYAARVCSGYDRTSFYHEITGKIVAELEVGRVPWVQPWASVTINASLAIQGIHEFLERVDLSITKNRRFD